MDRCLGSNAMIRPSPAWSAFALWMAMGVGCTWHPHTALPGHMPNDAARLQNPLFVPVGDREFLWSQIVDTLDDYFKIKREERVRLVGDEWLEGHIETYPTEGSTILEPWRKDSTPGPEKLHATLQSVRRYAFVRVSPSPTDGGYLLHVTVHKQLEDVVAPEHATVGRASVRHDNSLGGEETSPLAAPTTLGWIPIGRDVSLEQRILGEIQGRVTQ